METSMVHVWFGHRHGLVSWYVLYIIKKFKKTKILLVQTLIMLRDGTQCATCVHNTEYIIPH